MPHLIQYKVIFHLLCLVIIGYANIFVQLNLRPQIWGGTFVFLTQWGHHFNTLYWIVALFNDAQIVMNGQSELEKLPSTKVRKFLFSLVFTLSAIVCLLFWALFAVNPEFVVSRSAARYYPLWLSIVQHLFVFLLASIELLVNEQHNFSLKTEVKMIFVLVAVYLGWINVVAYMDKYPYPFQAQLDFIGHFIFNSVSVGLTVGLLMGKRYVVGQFWSGNVKRLESKIKAHVD